MIPINILDDHAAIGTDVRVLQNIHLKTKNLAVYRRGITQLKGELAQVAKLPMECRANGTVEEIIFSLSSYLTNVLPEHVGLLGDILSLLELFQQVTKVSSFRVSLTTVSTNMCSRFHADNNELRMLCTYYGPGTLWLPENVVDRKAYLSGKGNQNIVPDESLIQQVATGDVVVLKGTLYPDSTPVLHRSPNIEKSGEERLLLSIDPNQSLNLPL